MLGEDREGEIDERGGVDRVEAGDDLWRLGELRACLFGVGLGEEFCLSTWCLLDCFDTDGDLALTACCCLFKFWPL